MANSILGEVAVPVGDRVWILSLDFNALCDFEDKTGEMALEFIERVENGENVPVTKIRTLVWAMLLDRQPEATERDAGRVMSADPEALSRALGAGTPDTTEDPAGPDLSGELKAAE